jgi:hypothetical protein
MLGRAWLRVIWVCWHTNTPFDPSSTAPNNDSPPPDLTQDTETLRRPGGLPVLNQMAHNTRIPAA